MVQSYKAKLSIKKNKNVRDTNRGEGFRQAITVYYTHRNLQ